MGLPHLLVAGGLLVAGLLFVVVREVLEAAPHRSPTTNPVSHAVRWSGHVDH